MFLLDTNVVSELRRPDRADPVVFSWAESLPIEQFFLSAITILELQRGALLAERKDKAFGQLLRSWIDQIVLPRFAGRILSVDQSVALRCAELHVPNTRPDRDALIAATALVHGLTVATRNVRDLEPVGVPVFNPWQPQAA